MELGLVGLLEQLKYEIGQLQYSPSPMFTIDAVQLELKFVVEKSASGGGKFFVVEAKGEYKDQHVNTIKLSLKPRADRPPIAATSAAGY